MRIGPVVVIDTNVLVAATRSRRGASFQLIQRLGTGVYQSVISTAVALEYEDVLQRHASEFGLSTTEVRDILDYIIAASKRIAIHYRWRPFLPDPSDECLLELAVAAQAKYLITYNKRDFAGVLSTFGIAIVDAREFL